MNVGRQNGLPVMRERILITLKRGPLTYGQVQQRIGSNPGSALQELVHARLAIRTAGEYVLTPDGLAAAKGLTHAQRS